MSFSTFSAISELFVTAAVLYVVIGNFRGKPFPVALAFGTAIFEFCVNMFYMIARMNHVGAKPELSKTMYALAAIHGSLSLFVFIAYVTLAALAYLDWRRGRFYFQEHKVQMYVFLFFWMLSVGSGEALYFMKFGQH